MTDSALSFPDAKSLSPTLKARLAGDIFIPPHLMGNAMHGDLVLVDVVNVRPDGRAEGRIVRPVMRAHPTVVGIFHYGSQGGYVIPIDSKITQEIVIPPGMERPESFPSRGRADPEAEIRGSRTGRRGRAMNQWDDLEGVVVDVEITDWPSPTQNPRGRVIEILGREDDFGVDVEITIRKFHLPHQFSLAVLRGSTGCAGHHPGAGTQRRRDFRALPDCHHRR